MNDSYAVSNIGQASQSQSGAENRYSLMQDYGDPLLEGAQSFSDYSSYDVSIQEHMTVLEYLAFLDHT